ncbi:unnamed protein product [Dibothriocephalus latus]|uniref:Protein kinase domain-containing protein n=1 Tax=Dibothriocephalus latus TaxID=60516 RepID=A0A3P7MQM9_DIBLA|nr:unnamed protein product [Dibothriocephalus latus]
MSFLEEVEVVHRDLRAANVLVAADKSVKVADFGLTKFLSNNPSKRIATSTFPVRWTAPEAMKSNYKPSHKADVWSFGVLMFEVMTFASQPYAELSQDQILPFLQEGRRLPHPRTLGFRCDDNIYQTMCKCWSMQPKDRPDFKELEIGFETEISQEFGNFYGA